MSEVKKGNKPSWKPASRLGFLTVPKGYTPRWCSGDEANIQKKMAEGWVPVNKTTVPSGEHVRSHNERQVNDSDNLSGVVRYREMVGMMLPNELKEARDEFHKEENMKQLKAKVMMDSASNQLGRHKNQISSHITID